VRSFLLGAGIGEPVLSELEALRPPVGRVRAIIDAAKRLGKGPGVIVQNVRAEAERAKASVVQQHQAEQSKAEWAAFWGTVAQPQRAALRRYYIKMNPHMSQYTGGPIEDLPKFQKWAVDAVRLGGGVDEWEGAGA
jgi:hypothetical protein